MRRLLAFLPIVAACEATPASSSSVTGSTLAPLPAPEDPFVDVYTCARSRRPSRATSRCGAPIRATARRRRPPWPCWAEPVAPPEETWWVRMRTPDGKKGWALGTAFTGWDRCA